MIAENLQDINRRIQQAKRANARLIAVSKTFPASCVQEAFDAGQRLFGENRVQELMQKAPILPGEIEWHLIGHLQANKVRHAVEFASWIHSIDSEALLRRTATIAEELGKKPRLLLEVNVACEESKFGLKTEEVIPLLKSFPCPLVCGLMTVAPAEANPDELHKVFRTLRELRGQAERETGLKLPELSMGMSRDFEIALEEGATLVRVGSAIFGHRDYTK